MRWAWPKPGPEAVANPDVVAALGQARQPRLGGVVLDRPGGRRRPTGRSCASPARLARTTRGADTAGPGASPAARRRASSCRTTWGWLSPPIVPDDRPQRTVRRGDQGGAERVWRPAAGAELGGVAGLEPEADAAVVQEGPGVGLDEVGPEVRGVGLDEGDALPLAVDAVTTVVSPEPAGGAVAPGRGRRGRAGPGRRRAGPRRRASTPSARSLSTSWRSIPVRRAASARRWGHAGSSGSGRSSGVEHAGAGQRPGSPASSAASSRGRGPRPGGRADRPSGPGARGRPASYSPAPSASSPSPNAPP